MFPAPEVDPLVDDGWMLTGKATNADDERSPPPPPPPMSALNGKSPVSPEKRGGGRALRRFGVASDRTGVVRDSECVVVVGAVVVAVVCTLAPPLLPCRVLLVEAVVGGSLAPPTVAAVVSSICGRGEIACYRKQARNNRIAILCMQYMYF